MDRRRKKTREAIFGAFSALLSQKHYNQITVGEIIEEANVGRATFYAHFETKDFLLKALCEELFCHIFDATDPNGKGHRHIFDCEAPSSVFLHLLRHLEKNDHHILDLLACESNELFLRYFKEGLIKLIREELSLFDGKRDPSLPTDFFIHHVASSFVSTVLWWIEGGKKESPETLSHYFMATV